MFDAGPSPDLLRQLMLQHQFSMNPQGGMDGMMNGSMGGGIPELANPSPTFMNPMMRQTRPTIANPGMSGMPPQDAANRISNPGMPGNQPKGGIFSRMMGNLQKGMGQRNQSAPSGPSGEPVSKFGPSGSMTGMLTSQAPSFGRLLLDDDMSQKKTRSY